jgi:predicted dehydrogenase
MSERVRICIVGAGRVGRVHSNSIVRHVPDGQVVAIVDPASEILHATADEFGISKCFEALEIALEQSEFDAVVITTPTPTHKPLSLLAAEAGKHIFLEKPMALNLADCDAIISATLKNRVLLQLGFMRRFDPEFAIAAKRIEAGEIGQPMMIKSLTHGPGLPPPWARDLKTSNGMLAEVNSHDWDTVRWLMNSNIERVYTEVANFKGTANHIEIPHFYDNVLVNLKFTSGGLGNISGVCPCGYGYDARAEIIGDLGIMQIGNLNGQAVVVCTNRDQGLITPIYRTWPERFAWGYILEMQHFIQCVRTGEPPRVGSEEGRWAVAGVLAGTKSFLEERPVYMNEIVQAAALPSDVERT